MNVFGRYAPFIQDFIYQNNWESLRAVQVAAGEAVFGTEDNVLLCASTASGKTEAAFFPILTLFSEDPPRSVGAIYIGPLKALINDQFYRLNDLCREADIPVWHWHGDVAQSHKNKLLRHPSGILQITPESLEALLLHKHADVPHLFGDLRFIVIDEVHSLLRGDRGGQTLCLIERLTRLAGVNPRRIGLSATIGDLERTGAYLSAGTGRGCGGAEGRSGRDDRLSAGRHLLPCALPGSAALREDRRQGFRRHGGRHYRSDEGPERDQGREERRHQGNPRRERPAGRVRGSAVRNRIKGDGKRLCSIRF